VWIPTPDGQIFVRVWNPVGGSGGKDKSPIVLFHDSLGCVDLWRSFPLSLCRRTGRKVIAYDRLGHGKSDARGNGASPNFIHEEAEKYFPIIRRQFAIREFIAFGHSVGGAMAVCCAGQFAHACVALITESTQSFVEDLTTQGIIDAQKQFQKEEPFRRLRKYHGDKAAALRNSTPAMDTPSG